MSKLSLPERILREASALPEGTPLSAKALLHLGERAAIDQALLRLARAGKLMRAGRGIYVRPIETRFGRRAPAPAALVASLTKERGETVAPSGATAANALGLSTQMPTTMVYLTSGRTRRLKVGAEQIELRHAPAWQFTLADRPAGAAIRALAWLGPERAESALPIIAEKIGPEEVSALLRARPNLPNWLAARVSALRPNG